MLFLVSGPIDNFLNRIDYDWLPERTSLSIPEQTYQLITQASVFYADSRADTCSRSTASRSISRINLNELEDPE